MTLIDLLRLIALCIGAYLVGSIPFSLLVARARGVDLRTVGSGSIGASNVWRNCGFGPFLLAMSLDVLKGFLPTLMAVQVAQLPPAAVVLVGMAAILGHTFSLYLGFKGGKAVATSTGVLLASAPVLIAVGLAVWMSAFAASRMASVASLAGITVVTIMATIMFALGQLPLAYAGLVWLAACLIVYLHRSNIQRLRAGTESRFQKLW